MKGVFGIVLGHKISLNLISGGRKYPVGQENKISSKSDEARGDGGDGWF